MGTGYEKLSRSVMETAVNKKTVRRPAFIRRIARQPTSLLPIGLALLAAIAYAGISIYRHNVFASNAFDLGV